MVSNFICILFIFFIAHILYSQAAEEIFRDNLGDQMEIGLSEKGYKSVELRCGSDSMQIKLVTEDDFTGVIYTRGSYHEKDSPCFLDPGYRRNQRSFEIKFPLNQCKTKKDGNVFSNVLVLQHDKDLIMPGDAAFNLECDFRKPRDVTVSANLDKEVPVISRITLTNADPSTKKINIRERRHTVEDYNNTVILTPKHFLRKEEL